MVQLLEQQKQLIELYKQTHNKDYLRSMKVFSAEFHEHSHSLKDPRRLTDL